MAARSIPNGAGHYLNLEMWQRVPTLCVSLSRSCGGKPGQNASAISSIILRCDFLIPWQYRQPGQADRQVGTDKNGTFRFRRNTRFSNGRSISLMDSLLNSSISAIPFYRMTRTISIFAYFPVRQAKPDCSCGMKGDRRVNLVHT